MPNVAWFGRREPECLFKRCAAARLSGGDAAGKIGDVSPKGRRLLSITHTQRSGSWEHRQARPGMIARSLALPVGSAACSLLKQKAAPCPAHIAGV